MRLDAVISSAVGLFAMSLSSLSDVMAFSSSFFLD